MTRDEYYALLAEKHKQTDWNDRESVHAYNEYARMLRKQVDYDERRPVYRAVHSLLARCLLWSRRLCPLAP